MLRNKYFKDKTLTQLTKRTRDSHFWMRSYDGTKDPILSLRLYPVFYTKTRLQMHILLVQLVVMFLKYKSTRYETKWFLHSKFHV